MINDDCKIANLFNSYFANITEPLKITRWRNDLPSDNIPNILYKFSDHPSVVKIREMGFDGIFTFSHVYPWEVSEILACLDSKKSISGLIPTKILKLISDCCVVPLTDCINNCFLDCKFPDDLKLAEVIPVHKSKSVLEKENYRPISLLPVLSKVIEKLMAKRISEFFQNKLSNFLCGFRSKYSTQHALFRLIQKWQSSLDKSWKIGTILMDLSKAFDTLPHDLLIAKLQAYGFGDDSLKLISSYLSNRYQRVRIGSALSEWLQLLLGIPQGSILGPLLFNIFINDIFYFITDVDLCNFADDNTIYNCQNSLEKVITTLELGVEECLRWFQVNQMAINADKFQLMFLGAGETNFGLNICGTVVKSQHCVKLLGVEIDSSLRFDAHIRNICKKANTKIRCLQRIRNYVSVKQAEVLSSAYILSGFSYCPIIWMYSSKTLGLLIQKVQKRCLRTIHGQYDLSLSELLELSKTQSIHNRHLQAMLTEVYKSLNDLNPPFMKDYFKLKNISYSLRARKLQSRRLYNFLA